MILGLFSLLATGMYAQVRGTVKDSTGEPVPGANVFWMNTGQGVTTKVDGTFSITKPSKSHILVVSFIGFQNDTIHVDSKKQELEIVLRDGVELKEVNVVSRKLGTMKLRNSVMNEDMISSAELSRAACCNLGEFCYKSFGGCELLGCGNGSQTDKIVRLVGDLCTDVDGEHPELSWGCSPLWLGVCSRSLDAEYTGFQRNFFRKERLRSYYGTDQCGV